MKRLVLVIALCLLVLAAAATPALAWYAPQERTAYIDGYFQPKGWLEWAGPDDPLSLVVHRGDPIPAGWPVYVCVSWVDFKYAGAIQVPSRMFNEAAFARDGGGWTWEAIGPRTADCWSPVYLWDPEVPDLFGRDWWAPMGTLPAGDYSGWFRSFIPRPFPTWSDEEGNQLAVPEMMPTMDETVYHTFRVR